LTCTYEELSYAVFCLGARRLPPEEIPQEVLDRLAEINMILNEGSLAPTLTTSGRLTYRKIMGRERADIPQFNVKLPDAD
jgi:hypothetical protein